MAVFSRFRVDGRQGWQGAQPQFHTLVLDLNDPDMVFTETGKPLPESVAKELSRGAAHLAPHVPKASRPQRSTQPLAPRSRAATRRGSLTVHALRPIWPRAVSSHACTSSRLLCYGGIITAVVYIIQHLK